MSDKIASDTEPLQIVVYGLYSSGVVVCHISHTPKNTNPHFVQQGIRLLYGFAGSIDMP